MDEMFAFCRKMNRSFRPKKQDPSKPVACWSEDDLIRDAGSGKWAACKALVMIFRTRGCSWLLKSGCTMCGYFNDSLMAGQEPSDLMSQFEALLPRYKGEAIVKIFNSGSFLDDTEVAESVQDAVVGKLASLGEVRKISLETRPEYVTKERLARLLGVIALGGNDVNLELGIGLESASDEVRGRCVNKGFAYADYERAVSVAQSLGVGIKSYVLLKPPFLTEKEAMEDAAETIIKASETADVVSLNPVNVQSNTLADYLWKRKEYRPAWLWSVVEALIRGAEHIDRNGLDVRLQCDPVGGGSIRGAHNCGTCDGALLDAIKKFTLTRDAAHLKRGIATANGCGCGCREKWLDTLECEGALFGNYDVTGGFYSKSR